MLWNKWTKLCPELRSPSQRNVPKTAVLSEKSAFWHIHLHQHFQTSSSRASLGPKSRRENVFSIIHTPPQTYWLSQSRACGENSILGTLEWEVLQTSKQLTGICPSKTFSCCFCAGQSHRAWATASIPHLLPAPHAFPLLAQHLLHRQQHLGWRIGAAELDELLEELIIFWITKRMTVSKAELLIHLVNPSLFWISPCIFQQKYVKILQVVPILQRLSCL